MVRTRSEQLGLNRQNLAHEPLVDQKAFDQVQQMLARRARSGTAPRRSYLSRHPYIFKSLVRCGVCGRKMQGQHSHGIAYYRCRYPQEYALANHPSRLLRRLATRHVRDHGREAGVRQDKQEV